MGKKINELTAVTTVAATDVIPIANPTTGTAKKTTVNQLLKNKIVTLSDASTTSWDFSQGNIALWTIGGNRTLTISNVQSGDSGILKLTQDGVGSRVPNLTGNLSTWFELSSGPGETDMLGFIYDGTQFFWEVANYGSVSLGAPAIVDIGTADSTHIQVVFNQVVTATNVGWSFKKNGSALSASSLSGSGTNTLLFTVGTMGTGDTLTYSYNPTTGDTINASSIELATATDQSVTNNITTGYDSDAQTFFTAASISDTTQKNAVNQLILDLKAASIWTKIKGLYPVVGGSSGSHAVNAKTPGTYNLSFTGGITHSGTGMLFNGSTGFADTGFNWFTDSLAGPPVLSNLTNYQKFHAAFYNRTNTTPSTDWMPFGVIRSGVQISWDNYNPGNMSIATGSGAATASSVTNFNRLLVLSRTTSTSAKAFRDNSQVGSTITASYSGNLTSTSMYIGAANNAGTAAFFAPNECAFFCIGDELSDTEVGQLTTAVNTFETSLSRSV